ncbi:50S ribosomal protein L9 [Mycoplasmopsis californica]|uniref:Large ribosomal subunit protein bL9 n=1 Tax=Mycoplasmopsis equigenitalium TaxID=114883 RepID=A0ABY5J0Q4_9BACT|nr:50S ribosomal protein L9 [Mycoplasmopsis equigenitalium]UUD36842.1 50S ribosomal protein L9 [Mycoplasmopsis equigenitalium]VEU69862.1 50S ribosomal protein L9 [Mycoplasmopsis californica]
MKVILIKDCKDGKANQVIEVSNGYATNFLIKNKFAVAYNPTTEKILKHKLQDLNENETKNRENATELKKNIEEKAKFVYELETNIDANGNLNVHGSVSSKHLLQDLQNLGFEIKKAQIEIHNIKTLGLHDIKINLYKDIFAKITIEVKSHGRQSK